MRYAWLEVEYMDGTYDVCVDTNFNEIEEIRASDSEIDLIPVMDENVVMLFMKKFNDHAEKERAAKADDYDKDRRMV